MSGEIKVEIIQWPLLNLTILLGSRFSVKQWSGPCPFQCSVLYLLTTPQETAGPYHDDSSLPFIQFSFPNTALEENKKTALFPLYFLSGKTNPLLKEEGDIREEEETGKGWKED